MAVQAKGMRNLPRRSQKYMAFCLALSRFWGGNRICHINPSLCWALNIPRRNIGQYHGCWRLKDTTTTGLPLHKWLLNKAWIIIQWGWSNYSDTCQAINVIQWIYLINLHKQTLTNGASAPRALSQYQIRRLIVRSCSMEATRFVFRIVSLLWNLTGTQISNLPNFKAMR